ncbi:MAG: SDR family oxidoreductase [Myxococcota bacterium]
MSTLKQKYGPWAVVTGASDGIGREIACRLAEAGLHVVAVARRQARLRTLAQALQTNSDVQVRVVDADLSTDEGWQSVLRATTDLDVGLLVACAGFGGSGDFVDAELTHELEMVDVNCRALMALTHEYGRRFTEQGRGGMVLMSSLVAFQGVPRAAHYAATKAYVQALAEGLRIELAPRGVDVLASAPGPVHSGFASRADMEMGMGLYPVQVAQATLDALGRRTTVRPGWLSKFLEASLSLLPRSLRVRIMALVMGGMTKHQRTTLPEGTRSSH